ncbi:hypothetical protein BKA69DRAFT_1038209 [Paraphysoderma sedebokerense]|nr:hypothetical protein BKA69DRAFT_1038209 [Paraphysoderma sedebokerense]
MPPPEEDPPSPLPGNCQQVVLRKEWRECTEQEKRLFIDALQRLRQKPSQNGQSSRYEDFVHWHVEASSYAHGGPLFLPWHRFYLYELERELQSLGPEFRNVFIPYWQWSLDASDPSSAPVWGDDALSFGRGGSRPRDEVTTGAFAQWRIRRQWGSSGRMDGWYDEGDVKDLIDRSRDYDSFRDYLEGPIHGRVHVNVGGRSGDMSTMSSPNDPIFWLHHSNIDRIWSNWQSSDPSHFNSYNGQGVHRNDRLPGLQVSVNDIFDTKRLCYEFKPLVRFGILHRGLKQYVEPLPDWWINNQGLEATKVRKAEQQFLLTRPQFVIPPDVRSAIASISPGVSRDVDVPASANDGESEVARNENTPQDTPNVEE